MQGQAGQLERLGEEWAAAELRGDTVVLDRILAEDFAPMGGGPDLHTHPYAEVFVIQEGEVSFTVGDETIEAREGQILVVPAGVPHKYVNSGAGRAKHVDIHASGRMATEWLEDS